MKLLALNTVSLTERILNALALILLIGQFALIIGYYFQLPETIPVHFGMEGKPNRWGSRGQLFVAPIVSIVIFLIFRGIREIPAEFYNMSSSLTPEIKKKQVRQTHEMLEMFSFSILIFMIWTLWNWLRAAQNTNPINDHTVPIYFLVTTLIGSTVFYLWRMLRRN